METPAKGPWRKGTFLFPLVENDWVEFFQLAMSGLSPNFWISDTNIKEKSRKNGFGVSLPMTLYLPAFRCSQVESQSDSASPWGNVKLECCKSKWVLAKFRMFFLKMMFISSPENLRESVRESYLRGHSFGGGVVAFFRPPTVQADMSQWSGQIVN